MLIFFSLHCIKWKRKPDFGKISIDKNTFHKSKQPININKVDVSSV